MRTAIESICRSWNTHPQNWRGMEANPPINKYDALSAILNKHPYLLEDDSYIAFLREYDNILSGDESHSSTLWIVGASHLYFALYLNSYDFIDDTGFFEIAYIQSKRFRGVPTTVWHLPSSNAVAPFGIYESQYSNPEDASIATKLYLCSNFLGLLDHIDCNCRPDC